MLVLVGVGLFQGGGGGGGLYWVDLSTMMGFVCVEKVLLLTGSFDAHLRGVCIFCGMSEIIK